MSSMFRMCPLHVTSSADNFVALATLDDPYPSLFAVKQQCYYGFVVGMYVHTANRAKQAWLATFMGEGRE